jgi:hypothetical protein
MPLRRWTAAILCGVAATATLLVGPISPASASTPSFAVMRVTATWTVVDDDFGSDPTVQSSSSQLVAVDRNTTEYTYIDSPCAGGEVRAMVGLETSFSAATNTVIVQDPFRGGTGALQLYEGTSCSTNDRDGSQGFDFAIRFTAPNTATSFTLTALNTAESCDDMARVKLTLTRLQ